MFRGLHKYRTVYRHLWATYGQSRLVRLSFVLRVATRICKLIILPIAISQIVTRLSTGDYDGAQEAVLLFVSTSLVIGILTPTVKYIGMRGENPVYHIATANYFSRLVTTDLEYFNSNLAGYLTTATRQYCDSGVQLVRAIRERYLDSILGIVFPLSVITWLDVQLGLVSLALSVLLAAYLLWASADIDPYRKRSRELYKLNSGRMADVISNILAIKSTAQESTYIGQIKQGALDEASAFTERYTIQAKQIAAREVITVTTFMVLLWLVVQRLADGQISITAAVLVVTYTTTILTAIYSLSDNIDEHDDFVDKLVPALELFDRTNLVNDPVKPAVFKNIKGRLVFDSVDFSYQDNQQPVLQGFSLAIPDGQKVGIVGLSGAGKSTLAKLLLRFNDVTAGAILVDGIDIRSVKQTDLRSNIAYVPQEPLLFHTTVKDNVLLARPEARDKEVIEALKAAHAYSFVKALPDGLNSIVGERGVKLSGGQKQRIAIARAVLRKAPIIVLDEATSALDSESEEIIKGSFAQVLAGKTAIVIAHRLSTLSDMDRIIVINDGELVEDGTHDQLLTAGKLYAKLWKRQLKHHD